MSSFKSIRNGSRTRSDKRSLKVFTDEHFVDKRRSSPPCWAAKEEKNTLHQIYYSEAKKDRVGGKGGRRGANGNERSKRELTLRALNCSQKARKIHTIAVYICMLEHQFKGTGGQGRKAEKKAGRPNNSNPVGGTFPRLRLPALQREQIFSYSHLREP